MSATPTDLAALLAALPEWTWIVLTLFLLLVVLRAGSLAYKSTALESSTMDELARLTVVNQKLIAFCSKVLRHFAGCARCVRVDNSREELEDEYMRLMTEIGAR